MRLWVADFKFCLASGLRVVGVTLGVIAWVSVIGAEMQQSADIRTAALVGAAIVSVLVVQAVTGLPPSARVAAAVVQAFERDIVTVARERARGDDVRARAIATAVTTLATGRIRRTGVVPADRRAWLRLLVRLATQD